MSALEKKISSAYQWNKMTFFFTCSDPRIYFENTEIFWKSVGRKREVQKNSTRRLLIQILKILLTMFSWPLSVFSNTQTYTYKRDIQISEIDNFGFSQS